MSICNLVVQPDAAYIVSDSGWFDTEGRIVALAPKCLVFPDLPVAIACVGHGNVAARVMRDAPRKFGVAAFTLDRFKDFVRDVHDKEGVDPAQHVSRWAAAYYSIQHGRPFGFTFFVNPEDGEAGQAAWTWYQSRALVMPYVPPIEVWGRDVRRPLPDPSVFNAHRDAMRFVHAQRRYRFGPDGHCGVAGEIWLTKVSRAGIEEWKLHEYPDQIGAPAGLAPSPELSA